MWFRFSSVLSAILLHSISMTTQTAIAIAQRTIQSWTGRRQGIGRIGRIRRRHQQQLRLLVVAVVDRLLQIGESTAQPIDGQIVDEQRVRLQLVAERVLDQSLVELEGDGRRRTGSVGDQQKLPDVHSVNRSERSATTHTYLLRSVNSRYSSAGFTFCRPASTRRWMSWNLAAVQSPTFAASSTMAFHVVMKSSCCCCWCSSRPGSRIVRKSFSISAASLSSSTYSLWARCSLRQAFWYLSRTSSSLRPPRPAEWMDVKQLYIKYKIVILTLLNKICYLYFKTIK